MMPTGSNNCKCGYLLCYVATRALHFSAFILRCESMVHHRLEYIYSLGCGGDLTKLRERRDIGVNSISLLNC